MTSRPPLHRRALARLRSYWRGILHRSRVEQEMREEFEAHIELRADDLIRQGMAPSDARRQAHREFGHVETHRRTARAARGLKWIDQIRFSWVDLRLAVRMMLKYPWLTVVAAFSLAIGIPTGLAPVHLAEALDRPLPEDGENRIRAVRFWNPATRMPGPPSQGDLALLQEGLESFEQLGAFRSGSYNVESQDLRGTPVPGAEVTASMLAMMQVAPALGRLFDRGDEAAGAADVVLIGHRLWRSRFGGDPDIVGRSISVGSTPHTVVGVMPDGFLFPHADQLWVPLRHEASLMPGQGRSVRIVGRLAEDVSDDAAQRELGSIVLPVAHPAHLGVTPSNLEVVPFSYMFIGLPRGGFSALPEFHIMRLLGLVLLMVACANVAMLVFARTATRFRELAVRTALGAGRGRIVSQVFLETLVLALLAGGGGLLLVDQLLGRVPWQLMAGEAVVPYWVDLGVPLGVLPWAAALTVASATVAGVIPALWVTRKDVHASIRRAEAGRSGIRFGGGTSALVAADVALALGVIGFTVGATKYMDELVDSPRHVGIAAEEYLAVELRLSANDLPDEGARPIPRLAQIQQQLSERLGAEPGIRGVTFGDALPRMDHRSRVVYHDRQAEAEEGRWVRVARVDADFFTQLDQPILSGRGFIYADTELPTPPVIVNSEFARRVLGNGSPLGRRIRFSRAEDDEASWHEVVGVVGRLGMNTVNREGSPGVYIVQPPGGIHPVHVAIHVGPSPEQFVPKLREIVAETDGSALLGTPVVLARVQQGDWYIMMALRAGLMLLVMILLTLAATGIYAMVSFSVSERTREIGIRTALGASRYTLTRTILRRAIGQLGVGALLGIPLAAWSITQLQDPNLTASTVIPSTVHAVAIALATVSVVGLFSCFAPARRALSIEANDALRSE